MIPYIVVLLVVSISLIAPDVFAQQISIGEKANQLRLEIEVNSEGIATVKHTVVRSSTSQELEPVKGTFTNLTVTDENGQIKTPIIMGDNEGILLLPSASNLVVEYQLNDVITKNGEYWTWEFLYLESTKFEFPDSIQVVYLNGRSIHGNNGGILCHGCQATLEYALYEQSNVKDVTWEDRQFDVDIITHLAIENFEFDQPSKSMLIDITDADQYLTVVMPLELLWEPYETFLNEDRIFAQIDHRNDTHVWIHMKPSEPGEIIIIGTSVVPEFSIMISLIVGFVIIMTIPLARRVNLR